jgi:hypothetical protein
LVPDEVAVYFDVYIFFLLARIFSYLLWPSCRYAFGTIMVEQSIHWWIAWTKPLMIPTFRWIKTWVKPSIIIEKHSPTATPTPISNYICRTDALLVNGCCQVNDLTVYFYIVFTDSSWGYHWCQW